MSKSVFLDILVVFWLYFGQISFNLVQKAFATQQFALLATSIPFYDIRARAYAEIKILRFLNCFLFFFSFFSVSFVFASVIGLLLGLLAVKKILTKPHQTGKFDHESSHV